MNQSQPEKAERIEEFAKLAHSVKYRIEQQKTPNEEGANKALQILIDTHHQELQKTRTAEQERVVGIVEKLEGPWKEEPMYQYGYDKAKEEEEEDISFD